MSISDKSKQLHAINRLFALITGSKRDIADHVGSAINFSLNEREDYTIDEAAIDRIAQQLIHFYQNLENKSLAFHHANFSNDDYAPLWLREKMLLGLRQLSGYPTGVILVTGLRSLICPTGKRWTRLRQQQHQNMIDYMNEVAATNCSPYTKLHLLFLS